MIGFSNNCTGCGACEQVCPKHAISINEKKDSFIRPEINAKICVDCKICESVCPINKDFCDKHVNKVYAGVIDNNILLEKSTSGGAFYSLAEQVIGKNGVVYGCAYTEGLRTKHIRVDNIEDLKKLQGSKYVQSVIGTTYVEAQKDLELGKNVLFSGTPCQIAGLYGFLRREYKNLYTVDIICHGVSSQKFFDKYVDWYQSKYNIGLEDYNFRSKENCGWSLAGIAAGKQNGKQIKRKIYYFTEFYYYYFLKGTIYRESCYSCKYTTTKRVGDITLGDCWGIELQKSDLNFDNGCSLIITNSEKGEELCDRAKIQRREITIEDAVQFNKQLTEPSRKPQNREIIVKRFINSSADVIQKGFIKEECVSILTGRIKYSLPRKAKKIAYKMLFFLKQ